MSLFAFLEKIVTFLNENETTFSEELNQACIYWTLKLEHWSNESRITVALIIAHYKNIVYVLGVTYIRSAAAFECSNSWIITQQGGQK